MKSTSLLFASVCTALLSAVPAEAQNVGVSAAVNQNARGTRPGSTVRTIVLGDNVVYNERIETDRGGLLQILLADGTAFTVGSNSAISIDRFVYDPNAGTAQVSATLTKGVFRFIGGKTSKTPGGVSLETPVGTIGIRGGMANIESSQAVVEVTPLYGKATFTDGDGKETRMQPNTKGVFVKNEDGSTTSRIEKATTEDAKSANAALSSDAGENGGVEKAPTERDLDRSQFARTNSNQSVTANTPVSGTASVGEPGRAATQEQDVTDAASVDIARSDVVEIAAERIPVPTTRPDTPSSPNNPVPLRQIPVRLLTAGATYVSESGGSIANPGAVGLVGGSPDEDRVAILTQPDGSIQAVGTTNRGTLVLPFFSDSNFTVRTIGLNGGASLGGVALSGTIYSGVDGFAAYGLGLNGDPAQPVYALTGTPVPDSTLLRNGDVRVYSFASDMLQDIDVPFMRQGALGSDYSPAAITPFYLAEEVTGLDASSRLFQSWLLIDGAGPAQRSGIGVNVGDLYVFDDVLQANFGRRGSYRRNGSFVSVDMTGAVSTVGGPMGGNEVFGRNGQNIVIGTDFELPDFFGDRTNDRTGGTEFGAQHVLNLTSETTSAQFVAASGATKDIAPAVGTGRITGFSAGVLEGRYTNGTAIFTQGISGANPDQTAMEFDAQYNSVAGELEIGTANVTTRVAFGEGLGANTSNGQSAYITDDLFAATQNNNRNLTYYRELDGNGGTVRNFSQVRDNTAKTYFVSGDAVPQPNLLAGGNAPAGKMCDCSFLEWGWWGTQIRGTSDGANAPDREDVRVGVHLGTWVAGDIASTTQLAPLAGFSATYEGRAVGNVTSSDANGTANYVAAGLMDMSYDFGARTGTMSIQNFDGRDFGASLSGASSGLATFGGPLTQSSPTLGGSANANGVLQGAFVNDGSAIAQGVIGNFSATNGTDWSAVGITAGNQTSLLP